LNGQSFYYVCFQVVLAELVVGIGWRWTSNQLAHLGASLEYAAGNASNWSHLLSSRIRGISVVGRWECGLLHVANDAKVTSNDGRAEELYLRLTITRQRTGIVPGPINATSCQQTPCTLYHLVELHARWGFCAEPNAGGHLRLRCSDVPTSYTRKG
jgi:hypothetical protein